MSGKFKNKKIKKQKMQLADPVDQVYMCRDYFRPNTKHDRRVFNFFLARGGLGDYICAMSAFKWIAEKNPQVIGRIFVKPPFLDVAKYVMRDYKSFTVHNALDCEKVMKPGEPIYNPLNYTSYITAPGAHLMDLAFMQYCNLSKPPKGYNQMVDLKGCADFKWPVEKPKKYAVFTPGATAQSRAMPAKYFNELVRYTISKGVTPVFIGKRDFAHQGRNNKGYYADIDSSYDLSKGVDLTEKTTLLEAVRVIEGARFILGIDNGLLHFAGCTDTPIIFGHTVTTVEHRRIRRPLGLIIDIALDQKSLNCIGCQSNIRFVLHHRFSKCIYGDYLCLDMLFYNDCYSWKKAIDKVLEVEQ